MKGIEYQFSGPVLDSRCETDGSFGGWKSKSVAMKDGGFRFFYVIMKAIWKE